MRKILATLLLWMIAHVSANAQGCVAIRGTGAVCTSGTYAQGDAAFADYAVNIGASFRL